MNWTNYSKLTDEELIIECRMSNSPLLHEMAYRLMIASDELEIVCQEVNNAEEEISRALGKRIMHLHNAIKEISELVDNHKKEIEHLEEKYEYQIATLEEKNEVELNRINEFYKENQEFIAENKRLKRKLQSFLKKL